MDKQKLIINGGRKIEGELSLHGAKNAVSYTHLDVYKRQGTANSFGETFKSVFDSVRLSRAGLTDDQIAAANKTVSVYPVSYTHLTTMTECLHQQKRK